MAFSCLMFGNGQPRAGIIIQTVPDHQFDPTEMADLEAFRNQIWLVWIIRIRSSI